MSEFATIYPNRIVKRYVSDTGHWSEDYWRRKLAGAKRSLENLTIKKSSFNLSYQSQSKLRDSIQLLYELSKPRTAFVSSKKSIFNFRASFITLTLPSKQIHNDKKIKKCLNNFLVRLRQTYGVKNYVWKAELQKNENIHFHLVIDQYIPFQAVRYYWNLAINTLGYVDRYAQRMRKLSLAEYSKMRGQSVAHCLSAYQRGNKENWQNPPSEQAVAVRSKKQLAIYLSKYLTKPSKSVPSKKSSDVEKTKISISEIARLRNFGRVWARSQSLSKIKLTSRWSWEDIREMLEQFADYKEFFTHKVYDYCEIFYFNFKAIPPLFRRIIHRIIRDIGKTYSYPFPT